jgi:hypothetical protein
LECVTAPRQAARYSAYGNIHDFGGFFVRESLDQDESHGFALLIRQARKGTLN